ncbi:hypothetical protein H2201_002314 [Coniosporium apollinis]|uniref:BTB domain-containing protein n=1 Tax=Coniosporium apollinis TaxID=61459 RepID=A0ABQ9P296_9PEZI|nr:hypothetical protein H2201_002314 [Coniosporium apollinis]
MQSNTAETPAGCTALAVTVENDEVLKKRKLDSKPVHSSLHTFSSDVFEVHVGAEPVRFVLHEVLACRACPFFEKAIQGGFAEASSRVIMLTEDEPETFSEVVSWIYRDLLFTEITLPEYPEDIRLCKLWVLADKLCMPALQNRVMELITDKALAQNHVAPTATLDWIWQHTSQGSKLRFAFVDISVRSMTRSDLWDRKRILPAEFVQEFCHALLTNLDAAQHDRTRYLLRLQKYSVETTISGNLAVTTLLKPEAPGKEESLVSTAASPSAAPTSATASSLG